MKRSLLKFLFITLFTHFSFAFEIDENQTQSEVNWELIIPQEILQGTQCRISEEERLFIESFFS